MLPFWLTKKATCPHFSLPVLFTIHHLLFSAFHFSIFSACLTYIEYLYKIFMD